MPALAKNGQDKAIFEDAVEKLIVKIPSFLEVSNRRVETTQQELAHMEQYGPMFAKPLAHELCELEVSTHQFNKTYDMMT